jgi:replicative DNA helicase
MSHERIPPHDRDAERSIIGGILRDPDIAPDVLDALPADAMYYDAHRKILSAIADLVNRNAPVDLVALNDELRKRKQLEDIGGVMYLTELWDAVPTGANAIYHAKLVREAAMVRGLIHLSNEALRDAYDRPGSAEELVAHAERQLFALSADANSIKGDPCSLSTAIRETMEDLDARIANGDAITGLSTGFVQLDDFTGGMQRGEQIVLAARPSVGKTALATSMMHRVAASGNAVLFFSLEMTRKEIATRLLSMQSGVPMHRMARPKDLGNDEIDKITKAQVVLSRLPIHIEDASDMTAAGVGAVTRRAIRRHGVRLVIVDYLELLTPENPRDSKANQIGLLAQRMKQLARAANVPVLLLAQLNREVEHGNRKPKLSDLRDSGEVEQHADRVLLLHREPNLSAKEPAWPIDVIVGKNRNGPIGEFPLMYLRPVLRFENCAA